jgi:transcription antitermination factor NusG
LQDHTFALMQWISSRLRVRQKNVGKTRCGFTRTSIVPKRESGSNVEVEARKKGFFMSFSWYALHVRPHFEKYVCNQLEGKGYEVFLPTSASIQRSSARGIALSPPLFPGYVFCRFNIQSRLPILVTAGVNYVVGFGNLPVPADADEIAALQVVLKSELATQPWPYLKDGQAVRVQTGPLEGITGIVVTAKGCDRLILSMTLLMRSVSVEIDRRWIKPIDASSEMPVTACLSRRIGIG